MRRSTIFMTIAGLLLGAGVYLAFTRPIGTPTFSWLEAHPLLAFGFTGVAGFADGLNPCAITTLLLFVGALTSAVAIAGSEESPWQTRRRVWSVAGAYITGIFALYFALGAGFIEVSQLRLFSGGGHTFTRVAGFAAVVLGLVMVAEYLLPGLPIRLTMPASLHGVARRWGRKTTVGGALVGGVLIGLCTIPCGGAVYLAVAGLLAALPSEAYSYALLTSYNVAFVMPLVVIVAMASSPSVLRRVSHMHVRQRARVKFGLGLFVILVGLFALL